MTAKHDQRHLEHGPEDELSQTHARESEEIDAPSHGMPQAFRPRIGLPAAVADPNERVHAGFHGANRLGESRDARRMMEAFPLGRGCMKNKMLLPLALALSVVLVFPQTAVAAQNQQEAPDADLDRVLDEYSASLEESYYAPGNSRSRSTLPFNADDQLDDGLVTTDAGVTTEVRAVEKTDDGYDLHVNVTLSADLEADSETKIYLAGKPADSMHSSWTDEHVLHVVPDGSSSSGYTITTDEVVDPAEEEPSIADTDSSMDDGRVPASLDRERSSFDSEKRKLMESRADFGENSDGLNYIKAINYADKWTELDEMNPEYPVFDQNCANFVSQAVHEGGKPTHPRLWTYSTSLPSLTTKGWMNADSNYTYMKHYTNSFTSLADVWDAWQGSLLYVDWNSNGEIDHTMIVVGVVVKDNKANPVIDQKSNNRHQITLTQSLQYAHNNGHNNMTWYGLQYKYN